MPDNHCIQTILSTFGLIKWFLGEKNQFLNPRKTESVSQIAKTCERSNGTRNHWRLNFGFSTVINLNETE